MDNCEYIALFSHYGANSKLIHRKTLEASSLKDKVEDNSWLIEDEALMKSHGPVTDYIKTLSLSGTLLAKGIGKESKVIYKRAGISVKSIISQGTLPFKVNKLWTMAFGEKDIIVFDLLDTCMTVVYTLDKCSKALKQVPSMTSSKSKEDE